MPSCKCSCKAKSSLWLAPLSLLPCTIQFAVWVKDRVQQSKACFSLWNLEGDHHNPKQSCLLSISASVNIPYMLAHMYRLTYIKSIIMSTSYDWIKTKELLFTVKPAYMSSSFFQCILHESLWEDFMNKFLIFPICLFSLLLQASTHITAADIHNYSLPFTKTPEKFSPSKVFWSLWKNQASTLEEQQLLLIISWLLPNLLCHPCARWRNLCKIPVQQYSFYFYTRKIEKLFT